jgi:hypothetical protein
MLLRTSALLLVSTLASAALAQSGTFDVQVDGKIVGHDTYSFARTKQGYKLTSRLSGTLHGQDFDAVNTTTYTENYDFVEAVQVLQGMHIQLAFIPAKDRKSINSSLTRGVTISSNTELLTQSGPLAFLPPFDAGAAQAMLLQIIQHPSPKDLYSIYLTNDDPGYPHVQLPGRGGGRGAPPPPTAPIKDPTLLLPANINSFTALLVKGPQLTATLDGKPVKLNAYVLGFDNFRWIFLTDESNNLMEVSVPFLHAVYTRANLKRDTVKP